MSEYEEVTWLLPDEFDADTTTTDLDAVVVGEHWTMFPQVRVDEVPCERWGQRDQYSGDSSYLGDTLEWVDGRPEDHAIYVSHEWVYGGVCEVVVPPLECEDGYVPGWLDEDGNPTGCVFNGPNPGDGDPTVPVPNDPPADVPVLAETGIDPITGFMLAGVMVFIGMLLTKTKVL